MGHGIKNCVGGWSESLILARGQLENQNNEL